MIRFKGEGYKVESILTDGELEFLGELYSKIQDKRETFEDYIDKYKEEQINQYMQNKENRL